MKDKVEAQQEDEGKEEEKEDEGEEFTHTRSFTLQQQYLFYKKVIFRVQPQNFLKIPELSLEIYLILEIFISLKHS